MKKASLVIVLVAVLLSSCGTNAGTGAYVGGQFGHVIGSAIGGIAGGWRGHDTGALIGTLGGVVAGAAIGAAVDNAQEKKMERAAGRRSSGYDPRGRHDDRITLKREEAPLEIRYAAIKELQHDGVLTRGEECVVSFEIMNLSDQTVYDISPIVEDATGNKHVKISPNLNIESIGPRQGVRYTASILADNRLKDGEIVVRIGVAQGGHEIVSQSQEYRVPTAKSPRR